MNYGLKRRSGKALILVCLEACIYCTFNNAICIWDGKLLYISILQSVGTCLRACVRVCGYTARLYKLQTFINRGTEQIIF